MRTRNLMLLPIALLAIGSAQAAGLSGRDIMQRVKNRPGGDTRYVNVEMMSIQRSGYKCIRKPESWVTNVDKDTKKIVFFTYPGNVKGAGFPTQDYDDPRRVGNKWLYLPTMKETRRISGKSPKTNYSTGNDFTYNDMSMRNTDEEKHQLLREKNLSGHRCWVVQSIPNDKDETYARRITWVRQDCLMAAKAEYYDKLNKLHRRLSVSNIDKVQEFWTVHLMQTENVQTRYETVIRMDSQRFNIKMAPNLLTVSRLEKGL